MTIFVSVASYRDKELYNTLKNAIETAHYPKEIRFGVIYQGTSRELPDLSFLNNKTVVEISPRNAKGVGFARSKAMDLYDGEDYFLQIDSHTQFEKGWDTTCIKELNALERVSQKNILSAYPLPYTDLGPNKTVLLNTSYGNKLPTHTTKHSLSIREDGVSWGAKRVLFENPKDFIPEKSNTVLAGFIFARGSIVKEIPYDPEISFFGEEVCFAMRAWTRGYEIYSPKVKILYHHYSRPYSPKIWQERAVIREIPWDGLQEISREKQRKVLCGIESGIFGAGDVRSLSDYESFAGYNFKKFYASQDKEVKK